MVAGALGAVGANLGKLGSLCILIAEMPLQRVVYAQIIDTLLQFLYELEVLIIFGKLEQGMAIEEVWVYPGHIVP